MSSGLFPEQNIAHNFQPSPFWLSVSQWVWHVTVCRGANAAHRAPCVGLVRIWCNSNHTIILRSFSFQKVIIFIFRSTLQKFKRISESRKILSNISRDLDLHCDCHNQLERNENQICSGYEIWVVNHIFRVDFPVTSSYLLSEHIHTAFTQLLCCKRRKSALKVDQFLKLPNLSHSYP